MATPHLMEIKGEDLSQEMLNFVISSIDNEPQYVKETISLFLEQGSNVHYGSEENGKTLLHLVASNWDRSFEDLFLGKIFDFDIRDKHGRTPLHDAAAADSAEMIQWLVEQGADLEMKTDKESQTPLHYAARNDALQALKTLLKAGAILESRDYRCRTPLHLAVDTGRSLAANYLISLPIPAEARVAEKDGNMAISDMIKTMPQVAYKALNQLHQIDPGEREESFILSYLEPDIDKVFQGVKSPFDIAVSQKRCKILAHPVMQALIREKWRYLRVYFYVYLSMYILFLLIWSVLMSYPTLHEQHIYRFPRDTWRVVLQIVLVIILSIIITEEVVVVVMSVKRHVQHVKRNCLKRQEDLSNLILSTKEKEFLLEYTKVSIIPPYVKEAFTIITLSAFFLAFVVVVMFIINVINYNRIFADWIARITCFTTILLWFRVIKYLRAIPSLGSLISVIFEIKGDIFRYFLLASIIYIPYVLSMWLLFGGPQSASVADQSARKDLSTFYHIAVMAFRITLIDDYPYNEIRRLDEGMALLLIAPFLLFLAVIGLNLFIALLSSTFQRVQDDALANSLLQLATLISYYEEKLFVLTLYTRYSNHIRDSCNPLIRKYKMYEDMKETSEKLADSPLKVMNESSGGHNQIFQSLEGRIDANIDALKQELIGTVKDMLQGTSDESEEVLCAIPGGYIRSRTSRRRRRPPTLREKEWQRKIQCSKEKCTFIT